LNLLQRKLQLNRYCSTFH